MAYKFIKQSEEKGWGKKTKNNEITYDSVVGKICDATKKKLSGKDLDSVLRVGDNQDTYILRLFYGVKYIYSCEITLTGDDKGKGIKAAKKEAKAAINQIRSVRKVIDGKKVVPDDGLHKAINQAFVDRVAANAKAKKAKAEKDNNKDKDKNKVVDAAKPGIPGMAFHKK